MSRQVSSLHGVEGQKVRQISNHTQTYAKVSSTNLNQISTISNIMGDKAAQLTSYLNGCVTFMAYRER